MKKRNILLLALAMAAGVSTHYWYGQRQQRRRLMVQLLEMQQVLAAENANAAVRAEGMVKSIEANVAKAQRPPRQVAVLDTCQTLQQRTAALLDTLHQYHALAQAQAGRNVASQSQNSAKAADQLARTFTAGRPANQALAQAFADYRTLLPALRADSLRVAPPKVDGQPLLLAMAAISQAEYDLLAAEKKLLRHLGRRVGSSRLKENLLALATAETNVVRAGDTYRARLFVVKQVVLPPGATHMQCNGQPVAVNQHGIGQVRFRVPQRPGPASWQGAIRFNINGRDTTFQVRVPYRVAQP